MSMENEPNTIECVNFQMSGNNPSMKELMEGLVFSPNARFAVNFQRTLNIVTGIFILDNDSKKFYMYEADDPENDLGLEMDIFYWYGEECLIFVYGNGLERKFHQTPIVLNHQKRTFILRETRYYNWSPFGREFFKNPLLPAEATTIQLGGEKYVFWCAYWPLNRTAHSAVYLIPHTPNINKKIKKFYMPFYEIYSNERSKIVGLEGSIKYTTNGLQLVSNFFKNPLLPERATTIQLGCEKYVFWFSYWAAHPPGNAALYLIPHTPNINKKIKKFFVRFSELYTNLRSKIVGLDGHNYTYGMNVNEEDRQGQMEFWKSQEQARQTIEVVPQNATFSTSRSFLTEPGIHRKLGNIFISLIKEETSEENLIKLFYIDSESQTIKKVYEEVDPDGGAMAVSLTPFNLLFANEVSETKIRYRTLPLPTGNQLLSLKETLMRHVYFTDLQKSFYPSL